MDRVLLISGSSGIGAATARLAAERGSSVFITGVDAAECEALAGSLPDAGFLAGDLREEPAAQTITSACMTRFGRIDGLFNVAGASARAQGDGPVHECSLEAWEGALAANARSAFLLSREVLRVWLASSRPGSIVNMASVLAFSPEPAHFPTHAYSASKGAVIALTVAMAAYYAPHGIRVNALAPGLTRTPMTTRVQNDADALQFIRGKQPLSGGMLDAEDVARAALFLLSEESRHITGAVLPVDGGWSVTG